MERTVIVRLDADRAPKPFETFSGPIPRAILATSMMSTSLPRSLFLLLSCSLSAIASCVGPGRPLHEPTLQIEGEQGTELGVNTDYGILFLGQKSRAGKIEVTAWFRDVPNIETTVVEPVGSGIFTAETEIRLPEIALTFVQPPEGTTVTVIGRVEGREWNSTARIAKDPRVRSGILLESGPNLTADQIGAPVLVRDGTGAWRCLGLVSGRLRLSGPGGAVEYLTVLGPETTWRLVAHRRSVERRRRWVYREDVL